jgi:glycosyltransferase involved in cell wall biosynthesis
MREHFSIVFTGNVGQAQAMETIVEAADLLRLHPEIRFYVVGDGSRAEWMVEEVERRKLGNLRLTGRFPAADIPAILDAASGLLVTLRNDAVGAYTIPSKLQGYMAARRPIIACMNGEGARVVAQAQAGLVCPAENPETLADAVLRLQALSADERMSLGQNGYRYFMSHYEATRLTSELVAHLEWCRQKIGSCAA